jgi:hypothetical protein
VRQQSDEMTDVYSELCDKMLLSCDSRSLGMSWSGSVD